MKLEIWCGWAHPYKIIAKFIVHSIHVPCTFGIIERMGHCKGGNFNIHIWAWIGYFICTRREIRLYLFGKELISCLSRAYVRAFRDKNWPYTLNVKKAAKIRNRYNQVLHLTQRIPHWKVTKTQLNITNESQEVSPFPAGDHKAAMNRRESMSNTRLRWTHINP